MVPSGARPKGKSPSVLEEKKRSAKYFFFNYCSCNQDRNFSSEIDSITIGIELCNIPHISEHCPKNDPSLFTSTDT
jgi:hypothetical protein